MKMKRFTIITILFIASTQLMSCGSNSNYKELDEYIASIKQSIVDKKTKPSVKPLAIPPAVTYQADTLRSPFDELPTGPKKLTSVDTPLQAYPISMLRFVGTVTQQHIVFAFIMTPDKMIYRVKQGDMIGDRKGKVISIEPKRLNIMEEESLDGQTPIQRVVTMELKDER